jgi:hypothetical protein
VPDENIRVGRIGSRRMTNNNPIVLYLYDDKVKNIRSKRKKLAFRTISRPTIGSFDVEGIKMIEVGFETRFRVIRGTD